METVQLSADADHIRRFLDGDALAFDRLTSRYRHRIYAKIVSLVKDHQLAEDLLQETYIRILHSLRAGKYADDGRFGLWAVRIAYNLCIDHKRLLKRRPAVVLREVYETDHHSGLMEESSERRYLRAQNSINLQRLLNALPPEQRQVIFYRHFEQLSFKEIARLTNSSLNTTLGRMRYGLMNLRKLMKQDGAVSVNDILLYQ